MKTQIKFEKAATGKIMIVVMMAICLMAVTAFGTNNSTSNAKSEKIRGKVYEKVEQMPEFPGGQTALIEYIAQSVKYPSEASKKGTQGKVLVNFVVAKDGSVKNAKILQGVDPLLDAEALRVISSMPDWVPGKQGGKDVNVQYTIPIKFALK